MRHLYLAEKTLPLVPRWTDADGEDAYTRIHVPLDIAGVVDTGVTLSGGAYIRLPDEHFTFEIALRDHEGTRRIRLARVDWRDRKGGHSNPRGCSGPWSGRRVPETHHHAFSLNYVAAEGRMRRGKLPCAEPVAEPLPSFDSLREFVGRCVNIKNMDVVPPPPWEYDLFS